MISNMYTQTLLDGGEVTYSPNKLILAEFEPWNSLKIEELCFDEKYPSDHTAVSFGVQNTGLLPVEGFTADIYAVSDEEETLQETVTGHERILPGGTANVSLPVSVRGTDKITVVLKESGQSGEQRAELPVKSGAELVFDHMTGSDFTLSEAKITGQVTNKGNQASQALEADAVKIENGNHVKTLGTIKIPAVEPGETANITDTVSLDMTEDLDRFASLTVLLEVPENAESDPVLFDMTVRRPADIVVNDGIDSLSLETGNSLKLNGIAEPARFFTEPCVYTAADSGIAAVSAEGNVTALAPGNTVIEILYPGTGLTKRLPLTVTGALPTDSPEPSGTPEPADTPKPSGTPTPANTPGPSGTPDPANTPDPSGTPDPAPSVNPDSSPVLAAADRPTVNKKSGTYTNKVNVRLTGKTPGSRIYFTTDGKKPTTKSKSIASGKTVTIKKSSVLQFMAAAKGYKNSTAGSVKYTIKTAKPKIIKSKKVKLGAAVKLKAPKNVTLYFTVNGKKPTRKSKRIKAGKNKKIKITRKTIIRVIALRKWCEISASVKRIYRIKK